MRRGAATSAMAMVIALAPLCAWSCGVCLEDKVAATYDHAVVEQAASRSLPIVFCEVTDGSIDPDRMRAAARQVIGLDPTTLRFSSTPAALSFVLGEGGHSPESAAATLQAAASPGTHIRVIKVLRKRERSKPPSTKPAS